jgi:hypothetical protein
MVGYTLSCCSASGNWTYEIVEGALHFVVDHMGLVLIDTHGVFVHIFQCLLAREETLRTRSLHGILFSLALLLATRTVEQPHASEDSAQAR